MILAVILILLGFALLAKGADILVEGASSIAHRFHVSDLVVGFTIVALGTSAPELAVSVISAVKGSGDMALGNVLGSNIANLGLVLGLAGIIAPISVARGTLLRQIPFCLVTSLALLTVMLFFNARFLVSRGEAAVLLAGVAVFALVILPDARLPQIRSDTHAAHGLLLSTGMIGGGLLALVLGGDIIVRNSIHIARSLGLSEHLIAVTIVAVGTSLPEVAASIAAVLKGKPDMAVGNVVGSNILNTCLVLGCAGLINPFNVATRCDLDAALAVVATLLLALFMWTGKKCKLDRWEAALFLALYIGYVVSAVMRG